MAKLSQLLALPELQLRVIYAGPGDPHINWVSITELLNLGEYLAGGEIILTTGLALHENDSGWVDFVSGLNRARVAAIGFGSGVNHPQVPLPLIHAASTYGVPLFEIPLPVPFIAITKAVAELLKVDELRATHTALRAQQRILQSAGGAHPAAVLASIAQATGRQLALLSTPHSSVPLACTQGFQRAGAQMLPLHPDSKLQLAISPGPPLSAEHSAVVAAGAVVLGMTVREERAAQRTETQRWGQLATMLISGEIPYASVRLLDPTLHTPAKLRVLAVQGDAEHLARWRAECLNSANRLITAPTQLAAGQQRAWQIVAAEAAAPAAETALGHGLAVLIGRAQSAAQLPASAASLRSKIADLPVPRTGYGPAPKIIWVDRDEPVLSQVLRTASAHELQELVAAVLGPLQSEAQLLDTLRALFANDWQRGPSANQLKIHRNTLRERMQRITQLSGKDLDDPHDRAELWFALRLSALKCDNTLR